MNGVPALSCRHVPSREGCGKHSTKERNSLIPEYVQTSQTSKTGLSAHKQGKHWTRNLSFCYSHKWVYNVAFPFNSSHKRIACKDKLTVKNKLSSLGTQLVLKDCIQVFSLPPKTGWGVFISWGYLHVPEILH